VWLEIPALKYEDWISDDETGSRRNVEHGYAPEKSLTEREFTESEYLICLFLVSHLWLEIVFRVDILQRMTAELKLAEKKKGFMPRAKG
jgi:hypothetical protein